MIVEDLLDKKVDRKIEVGLDFCSGVVTFVLASSGSGKWT